MLPQADLHTSSILPQKFLYKSLHGICPQTRFLVAFCLLHKKRHIPLFLTVNSALQKKKKKKKVSTINIKLSLLTGLDGCYLGKFYDKMWLTSRGGMSFKWVFFKEIRN